MPSNLRHGAWLERSVGSIAAVRAGEAVHTLRRCRLAPVRGQNRVRTCKATAGTPRVSRGCLPSTRNNCLRTDQDEAAAVSVSRPLSDFGASRKARSQLKSRVIHTFTNVDDIGLLNRALSEALGLA